MKRNNRPEDKDSRLQSVALVCIMLHKDEPNKIQTLANWLWIQEL